MGKYIRKTKSNEELRALRSQLGKKGGEKRKAMGYATVGRKKGWRKDPALKAPKPKTLTIRQPDYCVYRKLATVQGVPLAEFMHMLAESLKAKNPAHFPPRKELNAKL